MSVCADDANLLKAGSEPRTRMIRVGDRFVPVHEVGGYEAVLDHDRGLFHDQQSSYRNKRHQSQVELWGSGIGSDGGRAGDRMGGNFTGSGRD